MRLRALAVPLLALGLLAVPADAAPKPARSARSAECRLFADPREATWSGVPYLDVVSGHLRLTATELVATLTVGAPTAPSGPDLRGPGWWMTYTGNGVPVTFEMRRAVGLAPSDRSEATVGRVTVPHSVSYTGSAIVWRVQRSAAPSLKRGTITVSSAFGGTTTYSTTADDAERTETRACVLRA